MIRIQIRMDTELFSVLNQLARAEMRDPRDQATMLIRECLNKKGLLSPDPEVLKDYKATASKGKVEHG